MTGARFNTNVQSQQDKIMDEELEYYFISASAHVLTEELPKGFNQWEEDKLYEFILDHAWEPFENHSADFLYNHIEDIALTIQCIANQG
jgi:hypothetical protein